MSKWITAESCGRDVLVNLDHVKLIRWSYDGKRAIFKVEDCTVTIDTSISTLGEALRSDDIFSDVEQ